MSREELKTKIGNLILSRKERKDGREWIDMEGILDEIVSLCQTSPPQVLDEKAVKEFHSECFKEYEENHSGWIDKQTNKRVEWKDFFIQKLCQRFSVSVPTVEEIAKELYDPWDKGHLGYQDSCNKLATAIRLLITKDKK